MSDNEDIIVLVRWEKQRRPVQIRRNADLSDIKRTIYSVFSSNHVHDLDDYQLQYYDIGYESFIDLFNYTLPYFHKNLSYLQSTEQFSKEKNARYMRIVPKARNSRTFDDLADEGHYIFQHYDDPLPSSRRSFRISSSIYETDPSLHSNGLSAVQLSENDVDTNESKDNDDDTEEQDQYETLVASDDMLVSSNNTYNLRFTGPLTKMQRLQFESEVSGNPLSKSTKNGVLLRAVKKPESTTRYCYPTVLFEIPIDQYTHSWYLYIYVLTNNNEAGIYYIHATKAIFISCTALSTEVQNRIGMIPNSFLVNPHVIRLSQDNIRDGRYELQVKVCNIKDVTRLRNEPLKQFPVLKGLRDGKTELPQTLSTMNTLNFNADEYRIGCILVQEKTACAQCISNLTAAIRPKRGNASGKRENIEFCFKRTKRT